MLEPLIKAAEEKQQLLEQEHQDRQQAFSMAEGQLEEKLAGLEVSGILRVLD